MRSGAAMIAHIENCTRCSARVSPILPSWSISVVEEGDAMVKHKSAMQW
jgi:hypothetical protein